MAQDIDYWNKVPFKQLLQQIKEGLCIPFIGPEVLGSGPEVTKRWIPLSESIATRWAVKEDYPLQKPYQLSRVAQYLAIKYDKDSIKKTLSNEFKKIKLPDFRLGEFRNTPLAVLADLNLPIYITTNYDHFIEEALRSKGGKQPISDFCRWNEDLVDYANENEINSKLYDRDSDYKITSSNPLVYHLHGDIDHPQSMVLTEKDYIDFIIFLNKEQNPVLPHAIRTLKNKAELLFVGYSVDDKSFIVIFQTVVSSGKSNGVSVQLMPPTGDTNIDLGKAKKYLEDYTKEMLNLYVYWGDAFKFSEELRNQLDNLKEDNENSNSSQR